MVAVEVRTAILAATTSVVRVLDQPRAFWPAGVWLCLRHLALNRSVGRGSICRMCCRGGCAGVQGVTVCLVVSCHAADVTKVPPHDR